MKIRQSLPSGAEPWLLCLFFLAKKTHFKRSRELQFSRKKWEYINVFDRLTWEVVNRITVLLWSHHGVLQDIVSALEDRLRPLVQAELSVLVDVLHRPELLFPENTDARKKCESGGFISK